MKTIISKYNRALENVVDACLAFRRLNDAAPVQLRVVWEEEIERAEKDRETNPLAMDIMHSRIKSGATLTEITTEIMREDSQSASTMPDDRSTTEWLLEGL